MGGGGGGVLLILDRGDVEVYGPNSKKGVLHRNFCLIQMLSESISYNYFESTRKKTACVNDTDYSKGESFKLIMTLFSVLRGLRPPSGSFRHPRPSGIRSASDSNSVSIFYVCKRHPLVEDQVLPLSDVNCETHAKEFELSSHSVE